MKSILLLVIAVPGLLTGQITSDKWPAIYEAEIIYRSGVDMGNAIPLYRTAFQGKICDASKILDAITCATSVNDVAAAIFFMEKGLQAGLTTDDYRRLWDHIGKGLNLKDLIEKCDTNALVSAYEQHLDRELIRQLKILAERDQLYREQDDEASLFLQRHNDSLNWHELKALVLGLGRLPAYAETGLEGAEDMELIFYHMDKNELEWFLPYVVKSIEEGTSSLGHTLLYQLDRIGMGEEVIYTISDHYKILEIAPRTKMKNGYFCQTFGEWFDERSSLDGKVYETPLDPKIDRAEISRVRRMCGLDEIASKRRRKPWVQVVDIPGFEEVIRE